MLEDFVLYARSSNLIFTLSWDVESLSWKVVEQETSFERSLFSLLIETRASNGHLFVVLAELFAFLQPRFQPFKHPAAFGLLDGYVEHGIDITPQPEPEIDTPPIYTRTCWRCNLSRIIGMQRAKFSSKQRPGLTALDELTRRRGTEDGLVLGRTINCSLRCRHLYRNCFLLCHKTPCHAWIHKRRQVLFPTT